MAREIVITRCRSSVSNDPLVDWPVRTSLFKTPEEGESRRSICWNQDSGQFTILEPRTNRPIIMEVGIVSTLMLAHFWAPTANRPNPTLGSETGGRRNHL
jgi:hypothetical protein